MIIKNYLIFIVINSLFSSSCSFINTNINFKQNNRINTIKSLDLYTRHINSNRDFYTEIINSKVKMDDVAGMEEAKNEVTDIIDFLKDSDKYINMGAKLPAGILLYGPPGTGKTLLAKAIAGEAGVPFFSTSGSSFVNTYVGVGANNIRTIFNDARENAPSIIFIDEIDAIGGTRTNNPAKNEERESTLNQLLVELDGFNTDDKVIVIASTNRPDILDEALLRNGRFDKKISVVKPDKKARLKILEVHSKNKPIANDVDLSKYSSEMTGFTGADISTVMNEAAILACKQNYTEITDKHIRISYQKQLFGTKLLSLELPEDTQKIIAIHEIGHCLMAHHFNFDKVLYVSIIPNTKGQLGITAFKNINDSTELGLYNKEYLISKIGVLLGGRIAEEIILGPNKITTGAKNDLNEAKILVNRIIGEFGLGESIYSYNQDKEKFDLLEFMYKKTKQIMLSKRDLLIYLSNILLNEKEIYEDRLEEIIKDFNSIFESQK